MKQNLKIAEKVGVLLLSGLSFILLVNCDGQKSGQTDTGANQPKTTEAGKVPGVKTKEEKIADGKKVYLEVCVACHLGEGQGSPGSFPPLAKSDYLNADKKRALQVVLKGLNGNITVNGKKYNNVMPAQVLEDEDVANVLTYVYNSWGNAGHVITAEEIKAAKQ